MLLEIFGPLALIGFVFTGLFVLNRWTRAFSELLWHLPLAPKTIIASIAVGILLVSLMLRLINIIPTIGALSMLIQAIVVPFIAVPIGNVTAFMIAYSQKGRVENIAWPRYIYETTRARQREAYNSHRGQK